MLKERHRVFVSLLIGIDTVVLAAAFALAHYAARRAVEGGEVAVFSPEAWTAIALGLPIMIACMAVFGLYRPRRDRSFDSELLDIGKAVIVGWGLTFLAWQLVLPTYADGRSATVEVVVLPFSLAACLIAHRYAFRLFLRTIREHGWNRRHMAIIGTGRLGQIACHTFRRNSWTGINCAYFISHHDTTRRRRCLDLSVRGGLDEIERVMQQHPVDGVIIALPQSRSYLLPGVLMQLSRCPVEVRIIPDVSPRYLPVNLAISELEGMPVLSVRQSPLSGYGAIVKRGVDLAVGAAALLLFGPVMLLIAALIRIEDGGPVLFRQKRVSMGGRTFDIYKFRTMVAQAVAEEPNGRGVEVWTRRDDPRITRIGQWLRRFSLDELPQLFNVLRGDMSLVGPRPERLDLLEHFREDWRGYMLRQNVKAGMTGWAQVNGLRGDTSLRKRLQYDLYYIRNWSLLFDLRILFLTLLRGFRHPNAH